DSKVNKFNSVNVGPKRDICMEWKNAAEKRGLPFGLTEHLAASFTWLAVNKGSDKYGPYAGVPYDGNDPECPFYFDNKEHYVENPEEYVVAPWYTPNEYFHRYWLDSMKELIDRFEPDLLYSDGALPFHIYHGNTTTDPEKAYEAGLEAVSYLYNKSIENYGENRAVYNQKERAKEIYSVGILDIEKSQLSEISSDVWQTDTCIGNWFYDVRQDYKTPGHIIEMLVDIISKNGVMLLNILQRPDGSIDKEAVYILEELEKWFKICAEAVYETEPWRVAAEGDSAVIINKFQEDRVAWRDSDFRFVKKDNFVYAYVMAAPESRVSVIKSFTENEKIKSVTLLGYGKVEFSQAFGVLTVKLPAEMPTSYTNCLKIEL
ncbi:MAG: alpha-L-fucosidase, partial [Clostridia bacterium]|nr:alpha-L-fucosidase [Clostridia bacterium]